MTAPVFTRILVGWDGSPGATAGLTSALRLTAADGGRVTALAVVPGFAHVEDAEERAQAVEDVRTPLRAEFDAVIARTDLVAGQQVSLEFAEAADVARALDQYAANHPIGLVVVGLHGREGLLHPKMGHVASHAVRVSRCPVLVVPEPGGPVPYPGAGDQEHGSRLGSFFHPFRHRESTA